MDDLLEPESTLSELLRGDEFDYSKDKTMKDEEASKGNQGPLGTYGSV